MSTKIDVRELPARFSEAVFEANAGADVIIMDGDIPRARLVSIESEPELPRPLDKRIPGLGRGLIQISDDFDDPLADEFWLGES